MAQKTPEPEITEIYSYRVERFEELGFTLKEAKQLAAAKDSKGVPVWPGYVKQAIDAGTTHVTAVRVFT
jgi:hypothetical protein